jgi:hypothetical protein
MTKRTRPRGFASWFAPSVPGAGGGRRGFRGRDRGAVTFSRLAVVAEQIADLGLLTAPKPTDRRAFAGATCQAEAIPLTDELDRHGRARGRAPTLRA